MMVLCQYPGYSVSGQGQKVLVNINVILISFKITGDKHFHISNLTLIYKTCKNPELVTTLFGSNSYDTIKLLICMFAR